MKNFQKPKSVRTLSLIIGLVSWFSAGVIISTLNDTLTFRNGIINFLTVSLMIPEGMVHGSVIFCVLYFGIGSWNKGNERNGFLVFGFFFLYMVLVVNYVYKTGYFSSIFLYLGALIWGLFGIGSIVYAFMKAENKQISTSS